MIVFKITYDTSVVADFAPTFNSGYTYTTKTSTSGTLKTVTYESDTAFTSISLPNNNRNCVKSVYIDLSGVTNVYNLFVSCQEMTEFIAVNATSNLKSLGQITFDCAKLTHITYENCDLSGVTNIQNIFQTGARDVVTNATFKNVKFNDTTKSMISILCKATTMVVEDCDFSSVTSFYNLFAGCIGLKGTLDLSMYDFTNVYETNSMFNGCTNLTKIIMAKGTFDKITNCGAMFQNCTSLVEIDLSGFHIPNAQNISYLFSGCTSIEKIDCSALGVLNPTNINHMFVSCQKLKRANVSGIKLPKGLSYSHMFYDSTVVEWLDISNFLTPPTDTTNFWKSQTTIKNVGMLYCPSTVINSIAPLLVNTGRTINIYYHDAKLEDLTVDSRFNYIYCEEYHGDVVSTPDDLNLYGLSDVQDTLDLTTGTYTQRVKKWNLAEEGYTLTSVNSSQEANGYVSFYIRQPQFGSMGNPWCISKTATHINNLGLPNVTEGAWANNLGRCLGVASNNAFLILKLETTDVTSYDKAGLNEWVQANNFTIYYNAVFSGIDSSIKTETYQVNINPLKSYRNGSITTSSQQLAPTLKTTLPISNKFITTNLTSGSTYNVYFDGTATKLDAGGTIITNPVSPCEVECGGTTLTIEGTDIQNVRVLETSVKNEVGSVCGTTDAELSKVITSDLEVITNNIVYFPNGVSNNNAYEIDNELGTIFTKGSHSWGAGYFTTNKKYPKGISLLHVEFDVDMPKPNLLANIYLNNNVPITSSNFRDLTLNNDTATVAQGQSSGTGQKYFSLVTKGHYSRLIYNNVSEGVINIDIYTGASGTTGLVAGGNNAEGSVDGYSPCSSDGITISNLKIKVIENYPDATSINQITSLLRTDSGLTVLWKDMNMSIGQTISKLEQPIKLRSLGTTYDSYNPVTGELTKRIGVSETDGSYSVLSEPIVGKIEKPCSFMGNLATSDQLLVYNGATINGDVITLNKATKWSLVQLAGSCTRMEKGKQYMCILHDIVGDMTDVSFLHQQDTSAEVLPMENNRVIFTAMSNANNRWCFVQQNNDMSGGGTVSFKVCIIEYFEGAEKLDIPYFNTYEQRDLTLPLLPPTCPQLYTNGQVNVYSESDVYPTAILSGQSTNNYEIKELNTNNNYTIRYDGTCESINLANKSNSQGTNRIVKSGATSGNLTFVNDSGNIDNVLLVEHDVREQEINHFNGLQTVEISQLQVSQNGVQNMFIQNTLNDFEKIGGHGNVYENGCLVLEHSTANQSGVFRTKEVYTVKPKGKILIRLVGSGYSTGSYQLIARIGNGEFSNTMYGVKISVEKIAEEISKNGYYDLILPNNNIETSYTGQLTLASYFNQWVISHVAICDENVDYVEPIIIDLPQPVQLNRIHKENMPYASWSSVLGQVVNLADGIAYDSYNPITGEYIQRVYKMTLNGDDGIKYIDNWSPTQYVIDDNTLPYARKLPHIDTVGRHIGLIDVYGVPYGSSYNAQNDIFITWLNVNAIALNLPRQYTNDVFNQNTCKQWLRENPITLYYELETPIVTQLTPINIPTFEGGTLQLITTDGKVFPMVEYSMPTNNRYDTSSWEAGKVYTQRNMTEAYFNDSTTPMIPTETMTLTTDHISSGSIILNDNGNGLIVLKGNYTGRDIPYFTGMRSVESIEVEVTPSPDQPLFGKGGRK